MRGDYEKSYEVTGQVREELEEGSEIFDVTDFVYGASAFHLGKIEEAEKELDAYLVNHPNGSRREPVEFYSGLTKVQQYKWEEAAAVFNSFIGKYPKSRMLPDALYQGALSEFMIDQYEPCLVKLKRIIKEFPKHNSIARAWNLKGDLFATEGGNFEDIEMCYLKGKDFADQIEGEEETAAYSLWQLLIHTGDVSEWEKCDNYMKEFQERHPGSAYRLDFLAASLPALIGLGKKARRVRTTAQSDI